MSPVKEAPKDLRGILRQLGPGLIISANIVGSGELIVTTKLGADIGFTLLWFIIFGCVIKVFLQVELGRYAIIHGRATLEALNSVPGPRLPLSMLGRPDAKISWLVWCWMLMFVATFVQVSGMVGGLVGAFTMGFPSFSDFAAMDVVWALLITGSCAALLAVGRYRLVERLSTVMVALFSLFTIFAVFSLNWTEFGITGAQIAEGLKFKLPDDFAVAFAAFGVIGVGAAELIYYPYWCLEKGYASHVGPKDGTPEWTERARGWMRVLRWDAWVSMVIYTGATVAFYLLGAAVLNSQGLVVEDKNLIPTLSGIYSASFGNIGMWVFLFGAFVVLYSTVFISTASNARLAANLLELFKIVRGTDSGGHLRAIRWACLVLPAVYLVCYLVFKNPVGLVFVGALAQALMLPFLCFAALVFHYRDTDEQLKPGRLWMVFLWVSSASMTSVGLYQIITKISEKWSGG